MEKDFDLWNVHKKLIENESKKILFKEGEVWWCAVGINVGQESCGKGGTGRRPVLIIKKLSGKNCIAIPLSTKQKTGSWFSEIKIQGINQCALLHQIRMFSTKRFQRRLTTIEPEEFSVIKEKIELLLDLSFHYHQDRSPGSVGNPKSA